MAHVLVLINTYLNLKTILKMSKLKFEKKIEIEMKNILLRAYFGNIAQNLKLSG